MRTPLPLIPTPVIDTVDNSQNNAQFQLKRKIRYVDFDYMSENHSDQDDITFSDHEYGYTNPRDITASMPASPHNSEFYI